MRKRITIYLDDIPRQKLKKLAIEGDKRLGDIVTELLLDDERVFKEEDRTLATCQLHLINQEKTCNKEPIHVYHLPRSIKRNVDIEVIALCEEHSQDLSSSQMPQT
mgnify:CR=1 FL=1